MKLYVFHSSYTGFIKRNLLLFLLFHGICISFAVEKLTVVSLRPCAELTNKVYQKDERLQAISLVCHTKYEDKNQ